MDFLKTHPETAGLLATADDPLKIVDILDTDADRQTQILGLFARCLGRRDISALAEALSKHRDIICDLIDRHLFGAEALFLFPRSGAGAEEYEKWLHENFTHFLAASDEDLASFYQFVMLEGRDLLDRLNTDESFRRQFRQECWPKLLRVIRRSGQALELYMDNPLLWPLLAHPEGERLLERHGSLAADLLFGPEAYNEKYHDQVIKTLLYGDELTCKALIEGPFRKESLFLELLQRPLPAPTLATAINKLFDRGTDYRPLLEKFSRLTDDALKEDLGPPPEGVQTWLPFYPLWVIARKKWQGRDTTTADWVGAGLDVVTLAFPLAKGGKVVTQSIRYAGRNSAKAIPRETVELGIQAANKKLGKEAAKQLARTGMESETQKFALSRGLAEMQQSYRSLLKGVEPRLAIEITGPVRFSFRNVFFGRETYKRFTGLEARVFMRSDAKVFVHVDELVCDEAKECVNDWLIGKAAEAVITAVEEQHWRRHLAAWWLLNTGDPVLIPMK